MGTNGGPNLSDDLTRAQIAQQQAQTQYTQAQTAQVEAQTAQTKQTAITDAITQYAGLVPDLTKVPAGGLTASTAAPLLADLFGFEALDHLAQAIVNVVRGKITSSSGEMGLASNADSNEQVRMLITNDTSLAVSESSFRELRTQLKELNNRANSLRPQTRTVTQPATRSMFFTPMGIAGTVAAAVPSLLSLFSAQRTISTSDVSADDLALAAAVIRRLEVNAPTSRWVVEDDTIRLLPKDSPTLSALGDLAKAHDDLTAESLGEGIAKDKKSAIEGTVTAIEQFMTAVNAIPTGATSSPLTTALLREQLDEDHPQAFTHVLVLSAKAGAASGTTQHRMIGKDKFTTIGTMSASYFLFDVKTRALVCADTVTRTATGSGAIGGTLVLNPADRSSLERSLNELTNRGV